MKFFSDDSRAEAPIAGFISGKFISRRIDRLVITDGEILFLDYKTDVDKTARIDSYKKQLNEYAELLRGAYPSRKISGYILWLKDWSLERIV
jgi:ATP-dependent helicase/nuclease subunit A